MGNSLQKQKHLIKKYNKIGYKIYRIEDRLFISKDRLFISKDSHEISILFDTTEKMLIYLKNNFKSYKNGNQ